MQNATVVAERTLATVHGPLESVACNSCEWHRPCGNMITEDVVAAHATVYVRTYVHRTKVTMSIHVATTLMQVSFDCEGLRWLLKLTKIFVVKTSYSH